MLQYNQHSRQAVEKCQTLNLTKKEIKMSFEKKQNEN